MKTKDENAIRRSAIDLSQQQQQQVILVCIHFETRPWALFQLKRIELFEFSFVLRLGLEHYLSHLSFFHLSLQLEHFFEMELFRVIWVFIRFEIWTLALFKLEQFDMLESSFVLRLGLDHYSSWKLSSYLSVHYFRDSSLSTIWVIWVFIRFETWTWLFKLEIFDTLESSLVLRLGLEHC